MTPQERQMINELFDKLARVEAAPRDSDAEAAIAQAWQRAPNAAYALVQTVLVQDEALKRADARIQELEGSAAAPEQPPGGFLDSMRDTLFGQNPGRGSVPNVRPSGDAGRPAWNTGQVLNSQQGAPQEQYPPQQQPPGAGRGGSFLGTAAAAAAGAVGGSLLLGSIRSMMGGGQHGFGDANAANSKSGSNPWASDQSGGNLARDAGVNDVGSSNSAADGNRAAGQFDQAQADADQDQDQDQDDEDDFADNDFDDFDDGDSDYA